MRESWRSTLRLQKYRARGWAEEAAWRLNEIHEGMGRAARAVLYAAVLLLVAGPIVFLLAQDGEDPAIKEMRELAQLLEADLGAAAESLPEGTIRNLVRYEDGTLEGTIAKPGRRSRCVGFEVYVGEGYVLEGDQGAVRVSPVRELEADDCVLKEGPVELEGVR